MIIVCKNWPISRRTWKVKSNNTELFMAWYVCTYVFSNLAGLNAEKFRGDLGICWVPKWDNSDSLSLFLSLSKWQMLVSSNDWSRDAGLLLLHCLHLQKWYFSSYFLLGRDQTGWISDILCWFFVSNNWGNDA